MSAEEKRAEAAPSPVKRAERRAALIGLAAVALFTAGGLYLHKAASEKTAREERRCLALLAEELAAPLPEGGAPPLTAAASCYAEILRARPFSTQAAFRAQAAADLAAWRAEPDRVLRGVGPAVDGRFRTAFAALARGRYAEAAQAFGAFAEEPGPQGALGGRYRDLAEELAGASASERLK